MTFASSLELIGAWRGSRMPLARFAPLAALLAWAAMVANAPSASGGSSELSSPQFAAALVLAFTLIAQFRLWDDLADRDRDAHEHPGRTLGHVAAIGPFVGISVMLAVFNATGLALMNGWANALGVLALSALALAWYRVHRERGIAHAHVVMLKYPAFVALLAIAPVDGTTLAIAAVLVYCALCAFELMDDAGLSRAPGGLLLALHAAVLASAPLVLRVDLGAFLACFLTSLVLVAVWRHVRNGAVIGAARYLPFLAVAIDLVFITLRGIA